MRPVPAPPAGVSATRPNPTHRRLRGRSSRVRRCNRRIGRGRADAGPIVGSRHERRNRRRVVTLAQADGAPRVRAAAPEAGKDPSLAAVLVPRAQVLRRATIGLIEESERLDAPPAAGRRDDTDATVAGTDTVHAPVAVAGVRVGRASRVRRRLRRLPLVRCQRRRRRGRRRHRGAETGQAEASPAVVVAAAPEPGADPVRSAVGVALAVVAVGADDRLGVRPGAVPSAIGRDHAGAALAAR